MPLFSAGSKAPHEWEEAIPGPSNHVKEALRGSRATTQERGEEGTAEGRPWGAEAEPWLWSPIDRN